MRLCEVEHVLGCRGAVVRVEPDGVVAEVRRLARLKREVVVDDAAARSVEVLEVLGKATDRHGLAGRRRVGMAVTAVVDDRAVDLLVKGAGLPLLAEVSTDGRRLGALAGALHDRAAYVTLAGVGGVVLGVERRVAALVELGDAGDVVEPRAALVVAVALVAVAAAVAVVVVDNLRSPCSCTGSATGSAARHWLVEVAALGRVLGEIGLPVEDVGLVAESLDVGFLVAVELSFLCGVWMGKAWILSRRSSTRQVLTPSAVMYSLPGWPGWYTHLSPHCMPTTGLGQGCMPAVIIRYTYDDRRSDSRASRLNSCSPGTRILTPAASPGARYSIFLDLTFGGMVI